MYQGPPGTAPFPRRGNRKEQYMATQRRRSGGGSPDEGSPTGVSYPPAERELVVVAEPEARLRAGPRRRVGGRRGHRAAGRSARRRGRHARAALRRQRRPPRAAGGALSDTAGAGARPLAVLPRPAPTTSGSTISPQLSQLAGSRGLRKARRRAGGRSSRTCRAAAALRAGHARLHAHARSTWAPPRRASTRAGRTRRPAGPAAASASSTSRAPGASRTRT